MSVGHNLKVSYCRNVDLNTKFHTEFVGMVIICLHTKFHMPSYNGSLVIAIK